MGTSTPPAPARLTTLASLAGRGRRIVEALATPLVPEDYLDLVAPLSSRTLRARIESVHPETADAVTLVLRTGRGWQGHRPGQYVRIGVDVDGVRLWRAYSVTSPPGAGGRISITIKAMSDGAVSQYLVRRARVGTIVTLDQAAGDFCLPDPAPAKVLFITAGSGVTPVMGMLRSRLGELSDVVHVHAAPSAGETIFGEELRRLARRGQLMLIENHDDVHGQLSAERLSSLVGDFSARETWACGPLGLLDLLERLYDERGAGARLHTERFRPSLTATGEGGSVSFVRQGTQLEAGGATTILDAGEGAGVLMPSGCRMGICFGCVVPLIEGTVRDLRTGEITHADPGDDVQIQTCIHAAAGACRIDL